ncbi:STAS domain-containing protein [Streptomyces sp. NPDC006368]|uniref:STAS domain-containing protein n=1 Tax=Streptomyces sp. NPDC006368 TaxID=3156760 RepID=UPI0033BE1C70
MTDAFAVTVTHRPDETVIAVSGEMDITTCPDVEAAAVIIPLGGKTLLLDLTGVSFMDSAGLNLLLRLRRRLRSEGGRMAVTGLQDQPLGVLHLTEAYQLFDIVPAPAPSHSAH